MEENKKFFEKTGFAWLMLFFFPPIGIFLIWKYEKYGIIARSIITLFFLMVTYQAFFGETNTIKTSEPSQITSETTKATTPKTELPKQQKTEAEKKQDEAKRLAEQKKAEEQRKKEEQLTFKGDMKLSIEGNKVIVDITSNVPDGGVFEVSILNGKFDVQSEFIPIKNGKIAKKFTIPKKWGACEIGAMAMFRFNVDKKPQPKHIRDLYGNAGGKMVGSQAESNNLGGKNGKIENQFISYPSEEAVAEARDKAFYDGLNKLIESTNGVIVDIRPSMDSWDIIHVIVGDSWYMSPDYEKERFCETVSSALENYVKVAGKVKEDGIVNVYFYDTYDKELASPKIFGGYEIER